MVRLISLAYIIICFLTLNAVFRLEGIAAQRQRRDDGPRGLGDFQRRSNRDERRGHNKRDDRREWDATPRGHSREDAPSVRVPNVGWDSTPRRPDDGSGWGSSKNRRWDAPTPRASRGGSPDEDDDGAIRLDAREWEEEQIRLDRDWYMGAEEGGVAGDEDYNPLAQYEDLGAAKQAELATKQVKRISARQAQYVSTTVVVILYMQLTRINARMRTTICGRPIVWSLRVWRHARRSTWTSRTSQSRQFTL